MSQLLNRARSLIQSNSPLVAALAILPVSTIAQADTVSLSDLQVNYSGAYFYNSSGYFAEYDSGPSDSQVFNETNPDGSPKLYGSLSVSAAKLYAHNMHYDDEGNPAYFSRDAGAVMVWGGTVQRVPGVGDSLSIHYDFSVGFDAPATGVSYFLSAYLGSYEPSNHVYNSLLNNWTEINGENLLGNVTTQPLQDYEIGSENYYWQIVVGVYGSAYDWGQTDNGIYTTHFPGVSLTVPNQSIDVSYVTAVPLPGAAVLFLGGLLPLLSIAGRRNA